MVNPKAISRGRALAVFTRCLTLACSGRADPQRPVLLAPRRRVADAGRWHSRRSTNAYRFNVFWYHYPNVL
jgi:hypothetical protein